MPEVTIIEITVEQQEWMLRELRRCRYGHLLGLHIMLLLARGKAATEIADFLFCSRSSVYRAKSSWVDGTLLEQWWPAEPEPAVTQPQVESVSTKTFVVDQTVATSVWLVSHSMELRRSCIDDQHSHKRLLVARNGARE